MVRAQPVSAGAAGVQIFNLNTVETFLSLFLFEIYLTSFLQGVFLIIYFHNANLCLYTQGQEDKQAQTQTHSTWKRNAKVTTINKL